MSYMNNDKRTCLYRHYDKEGILLYVGISLNIIIRTAKHENKSHWWRQICNIKIQHFSTRKEAEEAEREAISKENPLYNVASSLDLLQPWRKRLRYHDGIRLRHKVIIT